MGIRSSREYDPDRLVKQSSVVLKVRPDQFVERVLRLIAEVKELRAMRDELRDRLRRT